MKKNILYLLVFTLAFVSCGDSLHFKVNGDVKDGEGQIVYLEEVGIDKISLLDSFKIKGNNRFSFKVQRPVYSDFYRVRIKDRYVIFSVDSTETVTIKANEPEFINYTIKGSENIRKISELRHSARELEKIIDEYNAMSFDSEEKKEKQKELNELIAAHNVLAKRIILEDTRSSASYWAVFHKVKGLNFFDTSSDEDLKYYMAVATAYNTFYPHSIRGKHLTNLVLQAKRFKRSQELKQMILDNSSFTTIDITLPSVNGKMVSVAGLKGKVALVNFTNYSRSEFSIEYIYTLLEIYQRYHKKGFEIYGISYDDYDFFVSSAKDFPWIRVFDKDGFASPLFQKYDIERLPTLFLLDKNGKVISRHNYVDEKLLVNIEKLLTE